MERRSFLRLLGLAPVVVAAPALAKSLDPVLVPGPLAQNLLVTGTITADRIVAGSITADKIVPVLTHFGKVA